MTIDLTTFILEILNFFVLLWLLEKFLYKPVLKVINERQEAIEKKVKDAEMSSDAAQALKAQYAAQLKDWENEKSRLLTALQSELREARKDGLEKVRLAAEEERIRIEAVLDLKRRDEARKLEKETLSLASEFARTVLSRLASPDLEKDICKIFLEDLAEIDKERLARISSDTLTAGERVYVSTAYPLADGLRASVAGIVSQLLGNHHNFEFTEDSRLIAGIKLVAGGTVLQANLADALSFFEEEQANGKLK